MSDDLTRPYDPRGGSPSPDGPVLPPSAPGSLVPPGSPAGAGPHRPRALHLRRGLTQLSRGLNAYGIVGLVVAVLGLGVLAYVNTRIDAAGDRVETSVAQLATTLDRTAKALHDASTTAQTFTTTLARTEEAVSAAADTIIGVRTNLETLESVLRAVSIVGVSPLGPASDAVGRSEEHTSELQSR